MKCKFCNADQTKEFILLVSPHNRQFYTLYECQKCLSRFFDINQHYISIKSLYEDIAIDNSNLSISFSPTSYWEYQRNLALKLLAPDGRILLWGYKWMLRLFEDGCKELLAVNNTDRKNWLAMQRKQSPKAVQLLEPIEKHFRDKEIRDIDGALQWCRNFIVEYTDNERGIIARGKTSEVSETSEV